MKIQILSDIHAEFHPDCAFRWFSQLPIVGDVLVIAGDLGTGDLAEKILGFLCPEINPVPVVYVPGNHEYYQTSFREFDTRIKTLKFKNLHVLNNASFGNIHGTTLWFPNHPRNTLFEKYLTDFSLIHNFRNEVYERNEQAVRYLEDIQEGDIVVTHHCPTFFSVPEQYVGNETNRFFVSPLETLILEKKPKVWIHGHTHTSFEYTVGETTVVCNPYGYHGTPDQNKNFDARKVVET